MKFKVRYIYSACIVIETDNLTILCDPWFTDGIYDGSWFQFPKLKDPINIIGDVDIIYVSHIHPDHYDPKFILKYFDKFGTKRIITGNHKKNFLVYKAKSDGLVVEPIDQLEIDKTIISIFPNNTNSIGDIDTALLVTQNEKGILNLNDCLYNQSHVEEINKYINNNKISLELLCLGYTGAGPYPQTYYDDKKILGKKAELKKKQFFEQYSNFTKFFESRFHLPFAGKYILGGDKNVLNNYRGVADAVEVKSFDSKAIVIKDGGKDYIDLINKSVSAQRKNLYSNDIYTARLQEIKNEKMLYEKEIKLEINSIPFTRLLSKAYDKAISKSEYDHDYYFIFSIMDNNQIINKRFILNCNQNNKNFSELNSENLSKFSPSSEIIIDSRYFFGLLTGIYHWNNALIGSQYKCRRVPDVYKRESYDFLNFLSII